MLWLYHIGVVVVTLVAAPWVLVRLAWRSDLRAHLGERLGRVPPGIPPADAAVWVHAVSVGEVLVGSALVRQLLRIRPRLGAVLSTTTSTGREVAAQQGLPVFAFPLDLPTCAARALDAVRPRLVVLVETEIWPGFLHACARRDVPVAIVNGRISARAFRGYRLARPLFRRALAAVRLACVQTAADADRLRRLGLGADRVRVTGSLKYEQTLARLSSARSRALAAELGLDSGGPVAVAGSTSPGEEDAVLEAFAALAAQHPTARLVLAPRHVERGDAVARLVTEHGFTVRRRSRSGDGGPGPGEVLLLDTVGELLHLYASATVVFVGGSLVPRGGQNVLEPAAHGVAPAFGPHTANFRAATESLLEAGAGFRVDGARALGELWVELAGDAERRRRAGAAAARHLRAARGAGEATLEALLELV